MLDTYFVVNMGGKVRFCYFSYEQVNGHGRRVLHMMTRADFLAWNEHKPEAELWLKNPQRRMYDGLTTDPEKPSVVDGKLNLWTGFGIAPIPGDAQPFVDYVQIILACGQTAWAEYILNWLAWVVQNPGKRINVALCLISPRQGTGKGTLGNLLLTIFGQHGRAIYKAKGLVGDFNKHLADALFVFADEALFAGDLRAADALKSIVTEPYLFIEPKGVDAIQMDNRLSILMATNHRFAAQVEYSDRRYAMFEVLDQKQARAYWDDLHRWLEQGGKFFVQNYLMSRDLTGWHPVDDRPLTPIYMDSRKASLREVHHWWHETIQNETFGYDALDMLHPAPSDVYAGSPPMQVPSHYFEVEKKVLYAAYKHWHRQHEHKASRAVGVAQFWKDFYAMTNGVVEQARPGQRGEQLRVVTLPANGTDPHWEMLQGAFERWLTEY
ncbi:primase-helicase family protein [Ruegeria lacuscaerulensis]|uniref:primase-helicase family protein n=1 Tax=Ruegeria lacuscaerulensis TaxID=55218 RepID=UPI0014818ACA|nr:primase-helicase family protein [Ruegeria lacuscaerulensis]